MHHSPDPMTALNDLSQNISDLVRRTSKHVVAIHARRRIPSSGLILRPGLIVAANHTVQRDRDVRVDTSWARNVPAQVIGRDPSTDLVLLRVEPGEESDLECVADADLAVGQLVVAVGRPGLDVTASLGMINALSEEYHTLHGGRIDRGIELDLAVRDGFSGGALVSAGGALIGMNNSALRRAAATAVPWRTLGRVADQLLEHGHVRRGFLGLGLQPVRLTARAQASSGVQQTTGLLVVRVDEDGPADQGGVLPGDIVVRIDGKPATDPLELMAEVSERGVGSVVSLRVIRSGAALDLSLSIGERPHARCHC